VSGYRYDGAEAEDDFGSRKGPTDAELADERVRRVAADEALDKLEQIYNLVTDGDAPDIGDLEAACLADPRNMARRYAAIVDVVTGGKR
jgi:hypothetical protein